MIEKPSAILVSVDYADLLAITLPHNAHHFSRILVVTSMRDLAVEEVTRLVPNARIFRTDAFYEDGALFNKWKALEEGLNYLPREGWITIMDADILWPKVVPNFPLIPGRLYTPFRRMMLDPTQTIPPEHEWATRFELHRQQREFAGFTQIFHASDPHLGPAPWHETNWISAGGADSFFQMKWPDTHKIRPPFEVLHLGPSGENWLGRVTPYTSGEVPEGANEKRRLLRSLIRKRGTGPDRFYYEKTQENRT